MDKKYEFNPNGVGIKNGHFIGLPFEEKDAAVVLFPVPWDVTVSYAAGTSRAPENILSASSQLDLFDLDVPNAWQNGIFMRNSNKNWLKKNDILRKKSVKYIDFLENGGDIAQSPKMKKTLATLNQFCEELREYVYQECKKLLAENKFVALVGGDHSTPLGYLQALSECHKEFGILHFDAHCDLRNSYEGFTYSHASIFYNALKINNITKIMQVGIRDCCEEEVELAKNSEGKIEIFFDQNLKSDLYNGESWDSICTKIIQTLPQKVYVSFDIDSLDPKLCPQTGTPVPGGLEYQEAIYLLKKLSLSNKEIIGFDLVEVGGSSDWDGNVGARLLYKMINLFYKK